MATKRISGGHTSVGAMPRSYQVTPVVLRRRRATEPKQVRPNGRQAKRESARRRRETYRHGRTSPTTPPTMTLRLKASAFGDQIGAADASPLERRQKRRRDWCLSINRGGSRDLRWLLVSSQCRPVSVAADPLTPTSVDRQSLIAGASPTTSPPTPPVAPKVVRFIAPFPQQHCRRFRDRQPARRAGRAGRRAAARAARRRVTRTVRPRSPSAHARHSRGAPRRLA